MNKEEQILKLIEDNNGVITTKELAQNNINRAGQRHEKIIS